MSSKRRGGGTVPWIMSDDSAGVRRIVRAVEPDKEQPWVADATAELARETGLSVAVASVDESRPISA